MRGGSWINNASNCRSAYRNNWHPGNRDNNVGFRPASSSHRRPIVVLLGPPAIDDGADHRDDPLDRPRRAAQWLGGTNPRASGVVGRTRAEPPDACFFYALPQTATGRLVARSSAFGAGIACRAPALRLRTPRWESSSLKRQGRTTQPGP